MIAIKGMDMPKSCMKCKFTNSLHEIHYCLFNREPITDYGWQKKRPDFCPLTELPEENKDMSWEELVEKVKQLKSALLTVNEDYISYSAFEGCTHILEFGIDNQIVFRYADEEKIIHTDKSFYGMWVIIKALTGDER